MMGTGAVSLLAHFPRTPPRGRPWLQIFDFWPLRGHPVLGVAAPQSGCAGVTVVRNAQRMVAWSRAVVVRLKVNQTWWHGWSGAVCRCCHPFRLRQAP